MVDGIIRRTGVTRIGESRDSLHTLICHPAKFHLKVLNLLPQQRLSLLPVRHAGLYQWFLDQCIFIKPSFRSRNGVVHLPANGMDLYILQCGGRAQPKVAATSVIKLDKSRPQLRPQSRKENAPTRHSGCSFALATGLTFRCIFTNSAGCRSFTPAANGCLLWVAGFTHRRLNLNADCG